jgi:hypothetical protein
VYEVGEERDRVRQGEDRRLETCGRTEHGEADRDRADSVARANNRWIDESVRMAVAMVIVTMFVIIVVRVPMPFRERFRALQMKRVSVWILVGVLVHVAPVPVCERDLAHFWSR